MLISTYMKGYEEVMKISSLNLECYVWAFRFHTWYQFFNIWIYTKRILHNTPCSPLSPTTSEQMSRGFPCFTSAWPFQNHLSTKTIVSNQSCVFQTFQWWMWRVIASHGSLKNCLFKTIFPLTLLYWLKTLFPGDLDNESAGHSLVQCHWCMAFSRPSFH